ncbi:sensor histidine kinase [Prauserella endophytica]|uniref:histidine kinase n=1 Tax=Prauserella endophytica TaxID=1592324 RepID=A0ABY2S752_9PSEU|nr:HAMP domain-containing sensor histidine kinase [Prauserella endophytica]PXY25857.1 two-component sensor histidine kinase [Prauserella coralliicola]TKG71740.1 HAMP domain-containing histidine kinase [Prauserella endophytica]
MNGSAAARLRRLRWLLTVLFTVLNAAGLIVLAWLLVDQDREQGELRMDASLKEVTAAVSRLVQSSGDGTVVTAFIGQDQIDTSCPEFAVLPAGAGEFDPHFSRRDCAPVDRGYLHGLAEDSTASGREIQGYVPSTEDGLVRVVTKPFLNAAGQYAGAIVAVSDPTAELDRHSAFVWWVIGGCALAVAVVGVAGHLLSGRAIRPAAAALEQQEVLLAETAHDLRTPVAALRALAETAMRNPADRPDLLPRTVRLAARMGSIIDDLLVRARLAAGVETLAIQPVWLDQLVTGVVQETPANGAQVTVTTAPSAVYADPNLVQRAVGNLLDNALRYGRQPGSPAIVHITVAGGRVTVADHGPGIDASVAEESFDRFTSGAGSSGLGLSIVRWTAQAHGGYLRVYNAEEGGAIFELSFPLAQ